MSAVLSFLHATPLGHLWSPVLAQTSTGLETHLYSGDQITIAVIMVVLAAAAVAVLWFAACKPALAKLEARLRELSKALDDVQAKKAAPEAQPSHPVSWQNEPGSCPSSSMFRPRISYAFLIRASTI